MASLIYDHAVAHNVKGEIDFDTDAFKVLLISSSYTPNKGTDDSRNDIVANEITGTGYVAGGTSSTATTSLDTSNHRVDVSFSNVSWATATITARAAVIYKNSGSAATDWLIAYVDFGSDVSSTNAAFAVTFSSALRWQN